jgi:putative lipoprotein
MERNAMRRSAFGAAALIALAGCQVSVPFNTAPSRAHNSKLVQLAGSVSYRQRIALPDDAVLTMRLRDPDGNVVAIDREATKGRQVPLDFTLDYDPARIVEGRRYELSADIADAAGKPLWTSAAPFPVSFAGEPIAIMLEQAGTP